ncbi:MAG: hypothetical protein WAM46_16855, partial [Flavobacterium sp.]
MKHSGTEKFFKLLELNQVQRFLHFAADEKSVRYSRNDDLSIEIFTSNYPSFRAERSEVEKSFKDA